MTRKDSSFGQLVSYIERDAADTRYSLHHRIGPARSSTAIVAAFEANAAHLPVRRNGVALYHEILSISRAGSLPESEQKRILKQIAEDYIAVRAPRSMAYGVLHDDQAKQLHYHLVISANGLGERKRHRLARDEFNNIRQQLERQVLAQYPELEQTVAMNKTADEKVSKPASDLQRRTGEIPQRDGVKERLVELFATCHSRDQLQQQLQAAGLELYRRGDTIGVLNHATGRKHRLKTLGLDQTYDVAVRRMALTEARPAPSIDRIDARDIEITDGLENRSTGSLQEMEFDLEPVVQDLQSATPTLDRIIAHVPEPVRLHIPKTRHTHTEAPSLIERVIGRTLEASADIVRRTGASALNEAVEITKQVVETLTSDGEAATSGSYRPGFRDGLRSPKSGAQTTHQDPSVVGDSWSIKPNQSRAEAAHIAEQSNHGRKPAEAQASMGDSWNIEIDPEARRQHLEADRKRIADERREEMKHRRAEKDDHDHNDHNSRRR